MSFLTEIQNQLQNVFDDDGDDHDRLIRVLERGPVDTRHVGVHDPVYGYNITAYNTSDDDIAAISSDETARLMRRRGQLQRWTAEQGNGSDTDEEWKQLDLMQLQRNRQRLAARNIQKKINNTKHGDTAELQSYLDKVKRNQQRVSDLKRQTLLFEERRLERWKRRVRNQRKVVVKDAIRRQLYHELPEEIVNLKVLSFGM